MKKESSPPYALRVLSRLPPQTFGKPTTPNDDYLRCARLVHFEKAEEIVGAVPKERLVRWHEPTERKGIVGVMGRECFS